MKNICGNCKNWESTGWSRGPNLIGSENEEVCPVLNGILQIEIEETGGPYSAAGTVGEIETPSGFGCNKWVEFKQDIKE